MDLYWLGWLEKLYTYKSFNHADFDLEKERAILDEQGLRIAENQENSQKNRRKLAESTRGIILARSLL